MHRAIPLRLLPALLLFLSPCAARAEEAAKPGLHLDLDVTLRPDAHEIEATGRLSFPRGLAGLERSPSGGLKVLLHGGLELAAADPAWVVTPLGTVPVGPSGEEPGPDDLAIDAWDVRPATGALTDDAKPALRWKGTIRHPPVAEAEDYGRAFARSPGTIGPEGAVLTRSTWWVPFAGEDLLSFRLAVRLPAGWDAVSQGKRSEREALAEGTRVVWECPHPMEEVYLIASRFTLYERPASGFDALAYLRTPDPALAGRYLEATAQYVDMYRRLIGPYPFEKFALVENFWETGYGMPSFTLLGSQVIRLPFILHSSYPHEILHNWWGNSVYVDWERGNWCEGLTAYQADHLIREGQGRGAEYRFDTLKKYRSYVRSGRDFPLSEFRSRHSGATEAVGYGKSLLLFHMLRRRLGDDAFKKAFAAFYRDNLWRSASFDDVARAVSAKEDLRPFVGAWVKRVGAPTLAVAVAPREGGVAITLKQVQTEDPFPLRVPVAVTVAGRPDAIVVEADLQGRETTVDVATPGPVVRVDVDPEFDVFRRLDAAEVPASLGELFGAEHVTIVVPAAGKDPMAAAWRAVADGWKGGGGDIQVVEEDRLADLPKDRAVWVLGSANAWARAVAPALAPWK
ncbi:MAG TPA: M1 family aminopeptidase, partial [Planctomycetota bacterium]|nr:M1 family aminopeptidase [Planctomycetota bacterium]